MLDSLPEYLMVLDNPFYSFLITQEFDCMKKHHSQRRTAKNKNRFLLPLVSVLLMVQIFSFIPTAPVSGITPDQAMLDRNGLLWMNVNGFTGSITTRLRTVDLKAPEGNDSVIFGTTSGVYILDLGTGEVYNRIPVAFPVTSVFMGRDGDGDGVKDIGYTSMDQVRSNTVFVSSGTGKKLWDFTPTEKVYTSNLGWHHEETRSWDSLEYFHHGEAKLFVTSWRALYCLDITTGKQIWRHSGDDDFWNIALLNDIDGDGKKDIIVNTQEGALRAVSSATGKIIWNSVLEEGYEYKANLAFATLKFTSPKSLWKPVPIDDITGDGIDEIAVGSEMGFVYLLDGMNGKKLWEKDVISLTKNEKKERTNYFADNFGNIIIRPVDDCDGDHDRDMVVITDPGGDEKTPKSASMFVLSSKLSPPKRALTEKKSTPQFQFDGVTDLMVIEDVTNDGWDDLLIPSEGELKIVDLKEGNFTTSIFNHPFLTANQDYMGEKVQIIPLNGNNYSELLVSYGDNGLLLLDTETDEIKWDFIKKDDVEVSPVGDIDGKGLADIIVTTYIKYNGLRVRGIYTISSETGEVLWEKKSSLEELEKSSFHSIQLLGDVNKDGISDLSGFLQEEFGDKNDWDRYRDHSIFNTSNNSRVVAISGKDGQYIWKKNLTAPFINPNLGPKSGLYEDRNCIFKRITSVDPVGDMTGDGIPDVLAMGEGYWGERSFMPRLYLFSGSNGSLAWIREYSPGEHEGGDDYSWLETRFMSQSSENGTIRWESSIDGSMGTGPEVSHVLSTGNHTISVFLEQDGKILDHDIMDLDVVSDSEFYTESHVDALRGVAGSSIHVSAWGPDEADYIWHSDIDGFISDERESDIKLSAGTHNLTLRAEQEGRVFWEKWRMEIYPAPIPVFGLSANIDGMNLNNLPNDVFVTDSRSIFFQVYDRNDRDNELKNYVIEFHSDMDGFLGAGRNMNATLSPGNHVLYADIGDMDMDENTSGQRIYYNITVLRNTDPVPDFNSGDQGRVNEFLFENHLSVIFDANPSRAAAENPMEHIIIDHNWSIDGEYAGNGSSVNHYFNESGDHTISLSITNELGFSSTNTRTVRSFDDRMPEVRIKGTADGATFDTLDQVHLWVETRNVSFDTFQWESDLDGILDEVSSDINMYLSEGWHNITLRGIAHSGYTAADTARIEVRRGPDLIPFIEFPEKDPNEPDLRENVQFQVRLNVNTQGRNIDADALSVRWEANGVEKAVGREADITLDAGHYVLEGILEDFGQFFSARRYITVREIGGPNVNINAPVNDTATGTDVNFNYRVNGLVSVDNVTWNFGDGNISYEPDPSHIYSQAGYYTITLSARNDTNGTFDNRTARIKVVPAGFPVPVFPFNANSYLTTVTNMTFDAQGSFHSGQDVIENYTWDLGDGTEKYGETIYHTYEDDGDFVVRLTVRDIGGNTSFLEREVVVYSSAHPRLTVINFNDISRPNDGGILSATSGDNVNMSCETLHYNIPNSLYIMEYSSDMDGYLGAGDRVITQLSPGLHTITASLVRSGRVTTAGSRKLMVYDEQEPVIKINARDETDQFWHSGYSFPAGHVIEFDISSSLATADPGLGGTFDEIILTFTGEEFPDNPATVHGSPVSHYFSSAGLHHVTVEARNNYGLTSTRSFSFNIYHRAPEVEISGPTRGELIGREFEYLDMMLNTNRNNNGFTVDDGLNITWESSIDGEIGKGRNIGAYLSKGYHDISVRVDNGRGLAASDGIRMRIVEGPEPVAFIRDKRNTEKRLYSADEEIYLGAHHMSSISQRYRWNSSIDGYLGEGDWLGVLLSPGIHNITLECYTSEEKMSRDSITIKVMGDVPVITITSPQNSIVRGLFSAGAGGQNDASTNVGKVEFLAREMNHYQMVPQANGSYHIITSSWDRMFCGLIGKNGAAEKKPIWIFPDTFLETLSNGTGDKDKKEFPRLNDHFSYIENFDASQISIIGDINGDGVSELGLRYWGPSGNGMIMLDTITGIPLNLDPNVDEKFNALKDMERYNFAQRLIEGEPSMFGDDLNNDGVSDIVVFDKWSDEWERGPAIRAISGRDNSLIWEYRGLFGRVQEDFQESVPVTFIEDITGDGIDDIAVASVSEILLLDGADGKPVDRYKYQKSPVKVEKDTNPPPVSFITEVDDFTGDGKKDIVLLYQVETEVKQITELQMIDTQGFTPARTIPLPQANILSTGDVNGDGRADLMLSTSDLVFRLDSGFGLNIEKPTQRNVGSDRVKVTWDKTTVRCEVFVDRISWGYYDNGKAELTLTGGEHIVEVRLTDDFGGTVSDTVVIKVPESAVPGAINYSIIGILVILLLLSIMLPILSRAKREKKLEKQREESSEDEVEEPDEFITSARKNISRVWTKESTKIKITEIFFEDDEEDAEYDDYTRRDERKGKRSLPGPETSGGKDMKRLPPPPDDNTWDDDGDNDGDDYEDDEWEDEEGHGYGSRQWKDDDRHSYNGGDWLE